MFGDVAVSDRVEQHCMTQTPGVISEQCPQYVNQAMSTALDS